MNQKSLGIEQCLIFICDFFRRLYRKKIISMKNYTKKVTPKHLFEIYANCMIQLGIEVSNGKFIPEIIEKLNKTVIGLHLKFDEDPGLLVSIKDDPPIFKIPNHFQTLKDASNFLKNKHYVDSSIRLGSIGYNDDKIILNISHSVADGGYFRYIVDHLFSNDKDKAIPLFPLEANEIFKDAIAKAPNTISNWSNQSQVTRVYSHVINKLNFSDITAKYITSYININDLSNNIAIQQDENGKFKAHGITESLWLSIFLAASTHNNNYQHHISMPTCVDLRRYLTNYSYDTCNCFSNVTPYCHFSDEDTVKVVGERLRKSLQQLMKENRDLGVLRVYDTLSPKRINQKTPIDRIKSIENAKTGCGIELTYIGPIFIKNPIKDVWIGHSMNVRSNTISLMGFGVQSPDKENCKIVTNLRFPPTAFSVQEAEKMSKVINYFLVNINQEEKMKEVIKKLSSFYRTL